MISTDNFKKIIQVGTVASIRLCRLEEHVEQNHFTASLLKDESEIAKTEIQIRVTNIAQAPDENNSLTLPTDALCFEIDGKFYTYITQSKAAPAMLGKITAAQGEAKYQITKQTVSNTGAFTDSTESFTATNLAEIGTGVGNAIDLNTKVVLQKIIPEGSDTPLYFFSHNPYAKYLD